MTPTGSSRAGLSSAEAARRLDQYGPNDPAPKKQRSHLVELLLQFANPARRHPALREHRVRVRRRARQRGDHRRHRLAQRRRQLRPDVSLAAGRRSAPRHGRARPRPSCATAPSRRCTAPTSSRATSFASRAGDLVPADARLLEAKDLHVQQSALTGESMPVEKEFKAGDESDATMVLLGTSVVSGTATAVVLATGPRTAFGDIATRLRTRPPETEFDRGIKQFGSLIMKAVFGLVMFILVVRIGTHRSAFESLLFAVALAVGLTPEFLPMITSVTLARGAVAMAKHKVIVKHLSAIQNLGSIDVLCSDKTGTLTRGVMTFDSSCDALGQRLRRAALLRSPQQQVRDRDPQSARRGDPRTRRDRRRRARTRRSTRSRSTSSGGGCRSSSTRQASAASSPRVRPKGSSRARPPMRPSAGEDAAARRRRAREVPRDLRVAERARLSRARRGDARGARRSPRTRRPTSAISSSSASSPSPIRRAKARRRRSLALARDGVRRQDPHRRQRARDPPRVRSRSGSTWRRWSSAASSRR